MRKVSFYWIAAFLLAAFVLSMGGCGGSSSKIQSNVNEQGDVSSEAASLLVSSDMASVMHSSEWADLINEFEEAGSGDKMNPQKWVYCITDEEADKLREKYADDELSLAVLEALLFNAEDISRDYAAENIVLLIYPNEDFINRALEAVGLNGDYVMDSEGKRIELFAFAKRTVNDRTFTFRYQAFRGDDAVITGIRVSEDAEAEIMPEENESGGENSGNEGSIIAEDVFFNIDRWRDYYNWCASLPDLANEYALEASSIEVRSAAGDDDLTRITNAQSDTFNFDYAQPNYKPWYGAIGGDNADIKRSNQMSVRVYTCHSYKYHCDYYLVQTNTTTNPRNYQDKMDHIFVWYQGGGKFGRYGYDDYVNYIYGYTGALGFNSYIYSVVSKRENSDLSTQEVALTDYIPVNVPENKTVTKGIEWNVGGTIGIGKDGPSASINAGVTHSSSETWTTSDWEMVASPLSITQSSVKWTADVDGPHDSGAWHESIGGLEHGYMGISSTKASRESLSFKSEWIWQVDKSLWSKQDTDKIRMKINFFWDEGFCYGRGQSVAALREYEWSGDRRYPRFTKDCTMNLDMPRHSWVGQKKFDYYGDGSKADGFSILSEGRWTVEAVRKIDEEHYEPIDWITFTRSSGEATGEDEYPVRFQVAENNTGSPRDAEIIFTAYVGDKITETSTIYVNQAAK